LRTQFLFLTRANNYNKYDHFIMDIASIVIIVFIASIYNNDVSNAAANNLKIGDNYTVILGSDIVIDCGLSCEDEDETSFFVAWYFQAKNKLSHRLIQNCSCDRICYLGPYTYGTSDVVIHQIHNVHKSDEGFYSCRVQNQSKERIERTFINAVEPANYLPIIITIPLAVVILILVILLVYFYFRKRTVRPYYVLS